MSCLNKCALLAAAAGLGFVLTLAPAARAQEKDQPAKLGLGDLAPALKVEKFIKGEPVAEFKPGHIYVVEFWATWCGPCKASMPHMSELQKKYKDKVTFIGVNIWESRSGYTEATLAKVEEFVKGNSEKMEYTIAYDGAAKATDKAYMGAADQHGIPTAFIVSPNAKIAYIGHPMDDGFEATIQKLIDGKFDMKEAIAAAKEEQAREEAFEKNREKYAQLMQEALELLQADKIDEGLAKVDEAAQLVPGTDASQVELQKFGMLMHVKKYEKAYAIAAKLVEGPAKDDAMMLNRISWSIVDPEGGIEKPDVDLALKAAERAVKLTDSKEAAILDTLARCFWIKGDKAKAIEVQTQAVKLCESDPGMKEELQKTLDEYKK